MIFFEKRNLKGEVVARNFGDEKIFLGQKIKQIAIGSKTGSFRLISDESDLLKSNRIFKKLVKTCSDYFDLIQDYYNKQFIAHVHSLKEIDGQLYPTVQKYVQSPLLSKAETYNQQLKVVLQKIKKDPTKAASTLIFLQKRIFELGAHMNSFELLHLGDSVKLNFTSHNIRRLLLNIWFAFEEKFKKINIRLIFVFDDELAENNKISLDYKIINAAFYNFFDNALKYCLPGSEIRAYFKPDSKKDFQIIITMQSLRIEKIEKNKIFELGYKGINCDDDIGGGDGIGMYVFKKALDINNLGILINPDYSKQQIYEGRKYVLNRFVINGTLQL